MLDIQDLQVSARALGDALEDSEHIAVIEIVEPQKEYPVGAETALIVNVRCPEGCDLSGGMILIGDEGDRTIAEQYLTSFEEGQGVTTTGSFSVQIPPEPGEHTWTIVYFPKGSDAATDEDTETTIFASHAIVQAEYRFRANTHITGMTVYREYQPVEVGKDYVITVGVECLAGCSLLGQRLNVFCEGELLATAEVGEPAGVLSKLYQAVITLTAPDDVGLYELRCSIDPDGLGLAHTSNECKHYVTTRLSSQCRLDVTVVNSESREPLADASLTMRPTGGYPSWWCTNNEGKVSIDAAWGEHTITASCENYEYATETVVLSKGQEVVGLTMPMDYHAPLFT
jgi:hypothetical protein